MSDRPAGDRTVPVLDPIAGALIAVDFDGTLAPLVADPLAARPVPGVIATLATLAGAGARIAVVTGRDALTVLELGRLDRIPGLVISGLHGAESWRDGQLTTIAEPAGLARLRDSLPLLLPAGVWIEDKRLSLVLHARQADNPQQALDELDRLRPLISDQGLDPHAGKQVLEIRIPGLSKATALDELLTPDTTAALFAGDDLGDLPAVAATAAWSRRTGRPACTIAVGELAELRAVTDRQLDSPAEFAELLRTLIPT